MAYTSAGSEKYLNFLKLNVQIWANYFKALSSIFVSLLCIQKRPAKKHLKRLFLSVIKINKEHHLIQLQEKVICFL